MKASRKVDFPDPEPPIMRQLKVLRDAGTPKMSRGRAIIG